MEHGLRNAVRIFLGLFVLVLLLLSELDSAEAGSPEGHSELSSAIQARDRIDFIEVRDVTVTEILPDDVSGKQHQRWMFRITSGEEIMAIFNSETGEVVPLKVGDTISMGGQFMVARHHGPLLHWLHKDPRGKRPVGYVEINGQRYGEVGWEEENWKRKLSDALEILDQAAGYY